MKQTSNLRLDVPPAIDTAFIEKLRTWERGAAAAVYDRRVREIEHSSKRTFVELGLILNEIDERELWKDMPGGPWTSFDRYLSDAAPCCRASGYAALKAIRELSDVPIAELEQTSRANIGLLAKVPKHSRKPEVIERAKTDTEEEFATYIEKTVPEAHLEAKRAMNFKPERSQREKIEEAIEMAMVLESLTKREDALEAIASEYILNHQDEYAKETGATV